MKKEKSKRIKGEMEELVYKLLGELKNRDDIVIEKTYDKGIMVTFQNVKMEGCKGTFSFSLTPDGKNFTIFNHTSILPYFLRVFSTHNSYSQQQENIYDCLNEFVYTATN